jgi:hypothetical protein
VVDLKGWVTRWQHDAKGDSRWIALDLSESRWWIATVVIAIAAPLLLLSRPMGMLLLFVGLACFALAFAWDSVRWRWPLLPSEIESQITIGLSLLDNPEFQVSNLHDWQQQTRDSIAKIWSPQSRQMRAFEAKGGVPVVKEPGFHRTILIEQIHVLKQLDPTLP